VPISCPCFGGWRTLGVSIFISFFCRFNRWVYSSSRNAA
jgi:hypothetical protein